FDIPSQERHAFKVTLDYAQQQLNKTNLIGLQSAS
ncbi:ATP-dependent Clp protease ATP-binding subunit ClpX, partial [termite gut metagenome]